jgi:hypothetical protein
MAKNKKSVERQKSDKIKGDIIGINKPNTSGSKNVNNQVVQIVFPDDTEIRKVKKKKSSKPRNTQKNKLLKELKEALEVYDNVQNQLREKKITIPSELALTTINTSDLKTIAQIKAFIEDVVNKTNKLRELLEQNAQPSNPYFAGFGVAGGGGMGMQPRIIPPSPIPVQNQSPIYIHTNQPPTPPIPTTTTTGTTTEDQTGKALREIAEETRKELEREGKDTSDLPEPPSPWNELTDEQKKAFENAAGQMGGSAGSSPSAEGGFTGSSTSSTPAPTPRITLPGSSREDADPFPNKDASDFQEIIVGIQKITMDMPPQQRIDEGNRLLQRMEEIQNERLKSNIPIDINFVRERNGLAIRLDSIISQSKRGLGDSTMTTNFQNAINSFNQKLDEYDGKTPANKMEGEQINNDIIKRENEIKSLFNQLPEQQKQSLGAQFKSLLEKSQRINNSIVQYMRTGQSTQQEQPQPTELNLTKDTLDIGGKATVIEAPGEWSNMVRKVLKYQKDIIFDAKEVLPGSFHIPVSSIQNLIREREMLSDEYSELMESLNEQQIAYIDAKYAPIDKRVRQILMEEPKETLKYVFDQQKKPYKEITQAGERSALETKVGKELDEGKKLKDDFTQAEIEKMRPLFKKANDAYDTFKKAPTGTDEQIKRKIQTQITALLTIQKSLDDQYEKLPDTSRGLIESEYEVVNEKISSLLGTHRNYQATGMWNIPDDETEKSLLQRMAGGIRPVGYTPYKGRDDDIKILTDFSTAESDSPPYTAKTAEAVKNIFGINFEEYIKSRSGIDKKTIINDQLQVASKMSPQEFNYKFQSYHQDIYNPSSTVTRDSREDYLKKKAADEKEAERQASLANGHDWQFSS